MTQSTRSRLPASRLVLLVAALVAAFAVGFAISRNQDGGSVVAEAHGAAAAGAPAIEDLEKLAKASPGDAAAWQKLGFAYFGEGRFAEAAEAYDRATRIDPDQAVLWSSLGEALVMASNRDPMPPQASAAFGKAAALDPKDPRARYFQAVEKDLGGDHQGAIGDWLALLEQTPQDAPWRVDLIRTIEQVGAIHRIDVADRLAAAGAKSPAAPAFPVAARAIPGPTAQDLAAAATIPPGEQRDMAEDMVSRLETRLESDPGNIDGWVMLMRSRMALDQADKARKALRDAEAANPAESAFLRQQAGILGIR